MNLVAYGAGTNSTAMLIECVKRDINIDFILFSDTGAERSHTYAYVEMFSKWLVEHGQPEIVIVKRVDYKGDILTLEQNCLVQNRMPSIAYGFKSCSEKFKIQPQEKFCNNNDVIRKEWKAGRKITKMIGFDADEHHRVKEYESKKYETVYPLVDWGMGRDECLDAIKDAGLCMPGKSACFFCPSTRIADIKQLKANYPDLAERALTLEANAIGADIQAYAIKGLGRRFKWADVLATDDMFDDEFAYAPEMACGCYDG